MLPELFLPYMVAKEVSSHCNFKVYSGCFKVVIVTHYRRKERAVNNHFYGSVLSRCVIFRVCFTGRLKRNESHFLLVEPTLNFFFFRK